MAESTTSSYHHRLSYHWLLAVVAFGVLGFLLYGNTLGVPFYLDDFISIRDRLYALESLTPNELIKASFEAFAPRRPLSNLTFALNYYVHGFHVAGYHLVNVGIHAVNGFLLFLFMFKTLTLADRDGFRRHAAWIALISSLLWFVDPVQTQAVTYVIQRMTSMSALFFLASFLAYVYGRLSRPGPGRAVLFCAALLFWVAAIASKEIAFALPGLIWVYEWLFFQNLDMKWLRKTAFFVVTGAAGLLAAVYALYGYTPLGFFTEVWAPRDFTALERFLTQGRVLFFYMSLIIWPHPGRLNLNHDFAVSRGLLDPATTLAAFLGLLALFALTICLLKRHRIGAFALIWFFANVAIEALAADIELLFEHRLYLPSMFFFLPLVWLLFRKTGALVSVAAAGVIIVLFSLWTHERNALWNDPVSFWQDAAKKAPNHYRTHANLGISLLRAGLHEPARRAFEKALALSTPYPTEIYVNLGLLHLEQGRLEEARENLNRALSANRNNFAALDLLGTVSRRQGRYDEALKWYHTALEINPSYGSTFYNLGTLHREMGHPDKAVQALLQAVALRPRWAEAYSTLGLVHAEQQRFDLAESALRKAIDIDAGNGGALFNLARLYELSARPGLAAETYETILEITPEDVDALHNLGMIYVKDLNRVEKGIRCLTRALDLEPHHSRAALAKEVLARVKETR